MPWSLEFRRVLFRALYGPRSSAGRSSTSPETGKTRYDGQPWILAITRRRGGRPPVERTRPSEVEMPRWETLLRSVLRWTPRLRAERQKFQALDRREATMNCR